MSPRTKHFLRHYAEMVIAMYAGMALLLPLGVVGALMGVRSEDAPAVDLILMGAAMTWPMVAWMRYRGHSWRPCAEMAASMIVPTVAAVGLLAAGSADDGTLMALEHGAMFPLMLVAMLARPDEYTSHHHHRTEAVVHA